MCLCQRVGTRAPPRSIANTLATIPPPIPQHSRHAQSYTSLPTTRHLSSSLATELLLAHSTRLVCHVRQTARCLRTAIEPNLIHTYIEPRVREQEFGNLQGDEFKSFRTEQLRVGRFFYRFPTGESGADVYGRLCSWWEGWVRGVNLRPGCERADALIVVSHGLTMRLILMQLYGWSPNTFSTIWNAGARRPPPPSRVGPRAGIFGLRASHASATDERG